MKEGKVPLLPSDSTGMSILGSPRIFKVLARLAAWGLVAGLAPDVARLVGISALGLSALGVVGLTIGGFAIIPLSLAVLVQRNVRPLWRGVGALGVPLGSAIAIRGLWRIALSLGLIDIATAPPVLKFVGFTSSLALVIGLVVAVVIGLDLLRFLFKQDDAAVEATSIQ